MCIKQVISPRLFTVLPRARTDVSSGPDMRSVQSNTKCDPTERMLAVLADQQRRRILQHLETSFDDRVSVSRLARAVAEMSTTTKTGDKVERAAIRLRRSSPEARRGRTRRLRSEQSIGPVSTVRGRRSGASDRLRSVQISGSKSPNVDLRGQCRLSRIEYRSVLDPTHLVPKVRERNAERLL